MVTHQQQVKVCRSETDILPLSHPTKKILNEYTSIGTIQAGHVFVFNIICIKGSESKKTDSCDLTRMIFSDKKNHLILIAIKISDKNCHNPGTGTGNHLQAGKPSRYVTSYPGQPSLAILCG